jgi:hypothetical protein
MDKIAHGPGRVYLLEEGEDVLLLEKLPGDGFGDAIGEVLLPPGKQPLDLESQDADGLDGFQEQLDRQPVGEPAVEAGQQDGQDGLRKNKKPLG